jgi:hypothetical protein
MNNRRLTLMILLGGFILLIPLVTMQFTSEVNWASFDFVVAGALLLIAVLIIELVLRKVVQINHQIVLCFFLLILLLITWAELAVGIFGTPFSCS